MLSATGMVRVNAEANIKPIEAKPAVTMRVVFFIRFYFQFMRLRSGFERDFSDFNPRTLALDADRAGGGRAGGDFVHGFAVDDDFNRVTRANARERVPFADGIFA